MTALRAPSVPAAGGSKEYLTAAEIAAEGLPDLPGTKSAVIRYAERLGWNDHPLARKRAGRGGGMEYPVSLLPVLAQVAYQQKHLVVAVPEPVAEATPETGPALSARAAQERDARLAIVNAYQRFTRTLRLGHATHVQVFSDKYNAGSITVDPWVRERVPSISKRSLVRWVSAKRDKRTAALAVDRGAARKGTGVLDIAEGGRVKAHMLALIAHQPFLSAEHVRTLCRHEFGDRIKSVSKGIETLVDMPPVRTFQHTLKQMKIEHKVELTKLTNPDLYRSTMKLAGTGTLRRITEPNQLWQIDASPVDALCTDGRHSVYVCIDIATRRMVLSLSRTPRASAVALLIRKAIIAWGVPNVVKTDNGSDFRSKDTSRLFASLDIEPEHSDAYSPEQKGHVERAIRTFQHDAGPLLPGFIGHSVKDRQSIESRKSFAQRLGESDAETFAVSLNGPQLQHYLDAWAEAYHQRPHEGLGRRTPFAVALASTQPKRTVDERALDLLLMPVADQDGRRVYRKTGITIGGREYHAADGIMVGTRVFVRHDPNDLGRIYAFADDGTFLDVAICAELAGIHPQAFIAAKKQAQAEKLAEATKQVREDVKRLAKGPALIERVLEVRRGDMPNVIPLPKREVAHSTPQIAAALDAMDPKRGTRTKPLTGRAADVHQAMLANMGGGEAPVLPPQVTRLRQQETQQQRFRRALDIEQRHTAGEPVGAEELLFLGRYQAGPEYRAMRRMHDKLGEA